ncbi:MAG: ATP-binding protein [bacterium]
MFEQIVANLKPRDVLEEIIQFLDLDEIVLLTGARQTGKTSLMYLLADFLHKKKGIPESQIVWLDMEKVSDLTRINSLKDFDDFLPFLASEFGVNINKKRIFVFVDEIQYIKHASSFFKYLYDKHKGYLKFIATGSSSLDVKARFSDRLTGRVVRFPVNALSFGEFVRFREGKQKDKSALLKEYLLYGGYPKITLTQGHEAKEKLLSEIYSLYVRKDVRDIAGIGDVMGFNKLVTILASQIGSLLNETELANASQLSRITARKYLFILENTFVISLVSPFHRNPRTEIVKSPKIYFRDLGLRNAVLDNFSALEKRADAGFLAENFAFLQLSGKYKKVNFWRSKAKAEADFVVIKGDSFSVVEVKYRHFKRPQIPSGMRAFLKNYPNTSKATVANRSLESSVSCYDQTVDFSLLENL